MTVATVRLAGALVGASTRIELSVAGDVQAIRHGDSTLVNQYLPTPHDAMVGGVFLRRHTPQVAVESVVLVGGRANGTFTLDDRCARWSGRALGAQYSVTLTLDPDGVFWVWRVDLSDAPTGAGPVPEAPSTYDVVLAQDVALAPESMSMSSEPYISQYVVHHVIDAERAVPTIASRQTMASAPDLPLALTVVIEGAQAHLTDGFSFYGLGAKVDGHAAALDVASWESLTYQYEFAMPTLLGPRLDLTTPRTVHGVTAFVPDYRGELADALDAVPHLFDRAVALARTTAPPASPGAERPATGADEQGARGGRVPSGLSAPSLPSAHAARSLLVSARLLAGRDLTDDELVGLTATTVTTATSPTSPTAASTAHVLRPETAPDGTLLSYFTPEATHVISRAKELLVERPHGHVLKAGSDVTPNANVLSATAYAYGVFASHVVVGNTSANRFVSVQRNHLNLLRSSGVRVLARLDGAWRLLGAPSALVMDLGGLRWVYATDAGRIDVRTVVRSDARGLELRIDAEQALDLLVTVDVELGAGDWSATSELDGRALAFTADAGTDVAAHCPDLAYVIATATGRLGDDAVLFPDGRSRDTPVVTVRFDAATNASVVLSGDLEGPSAALRVAREGIDHPLDVETELAAHRAYVADFTRHLHVDGDGRLAELNLLLPWFTQNALVHFLVPHGLEQYSGAAWGTRDVCQGPLELNLAFGHHDTVRDIVLRVFAHQFVDGTLPQWFMLDSYAERYQDDAHGDVVVWPLVALGEYLAATGDTAVLDATIPFWDHAHRRAGTVPVPVAEHVRRSLDHIRSHRAPGTRLLSYGEGDWDDTLQPAQSSMKEEMASAWTVALLYQATRALEDLLRGTVHADLAAELGTEADTIAAEFTDRFVIDDVLAGYVVFAPEGPWPVIHPSDDRTGLHYRLIPMTRSIIAGLFTPDQALRHEALVEEHLHFPDGVRLMDRPAPFHDGITRFFRRGEQAANFGREVGLMYTHAHVRYTQALATLGRDRLVAELLRISPVGQHDRLAASAPRQRNCYFSSSDAAFTDRYDAAAHFDRLRTGAIGVKGGWRVYSSGPGIYLRQVVQGALGIVERSGAVVFDPVLSLEDDGTTLGIDLGGVHRTVRYHVEVGNAPVRVEVDGVPVPGVEVAAVYRRGGFRVAAADLRGSGEAPSGVIDVYGGDDRSTLHA